MLSDKNYVDLIWRFKIEDGLSWRFCAGVLEYSNIQITPQTLKRKFINYFEKLTGTKPYTPCPKCQGELLPRQSEYGYFIGCSNFQKCRYIVKPKKELNK